MGELQRRTGAYADCTSLDEKVRYVFFLDESATLMIYLPRLRPKYTRFWISPGVPPVLWRCGTGLKGAEDKTQRSIKWLLFP